MGDASTRAENVYIVKWLGETRDRGEFDGGKVVDGFYYTEYIFYLRKAKDTGLSSC